MKTLAGLLKKKKKSKTPILNTWRKCFFTLFILSCKDQIVFLEIVFLTAPLSETFAPTTKAYEKSQNLHPLWKIIFDIMNSTPPKNSWHRTEYTIKIRMRPKSLMGLGKSISESTNKTKTQMSGSFFLSLRVSYTTYSLAAVWGKSFSDFMGKNFSLSHLYKVSHTYCRLKSRTTTTILLTFDLGESCHLKKKNHV